MPQECVVLRCFRCDTFQVHTAKKSNKWICKICNEKQSVKHVYGKGSGKECRLHVQQLNNLRMLKDNTKQETFDENTESIINQSSSNLNDDSIIQSGSKWLKYVDPNEQPSEIDNSLDAGILDGCRVVFDIEKTAKKRKVTSEFEYFNKRNFTDRTETEKSFKNNKSHNINVLKNNITKKNNSYNTGFKSKLFEICDTVLADDLDQNVGDVKTEIQVKKIHKRINCNINSKWSKFIEHKDDADEIDNMSYRKKLGEEDHGDTILCQRVGVSTKENRFSGRGIKSKWSKYITDDQESLDEDDIISKHSVMSSVRQDFSPESKIKLISEVNNEINLLNSSLENESIEKKTLVDINKNPKIIESKGENIFMDGEVVDNLDEILSF